MDVLDFAVKTESFHIADCDLGAHTVVAGARQAAANVCGEWEDAIPFPTAGPRAPVFGKIPEDADPEVSLVGVEL